MPTKEICTNCGGRGYREFYNPDDDTWIKQGCYLCMRTGYIMETTFQEKKEAKDVRINGGNSHQGPETH